MNQRIKSGKEMLDEFFGNLEKIPNIDKEITGLLKRLYEENKFTDTNLTNALQKLREEKGNAKN